MINWHVVYQLGRIFYLSTTACHLELPACKGLMDKQERQRGTNHYSKQTDQSNHSALPAHLFLQQQGHAVHHLVPIKRSGCDVEEEAVEDRLGDPLQRNWQHERRQADQDVGHQRGQTRLLHTDNTVQHKGIFKEKSTLNTLSITERWLACDPRK